MPVKISTKSFIDLISISFTTFVNFSANTGLIYPFVKQSNLSTDSSQVNGQQGIPG